MVLYSLFNGSFGGVFWFETFYAWYFSRASYGFCLLFSATSFILATTSAFFAGLFWKDFSSL